MSLFEILIYGRETFKISSSDFCIYVIKSLLRMDSDSHERSSVRYMVLLLRSIEIDHGKSTCPGSRPQVP